MDIKIKRIYEVPSPSDGFRVLVDRLWPRGISKEHADLDLWAKQIAPSTEIRKAFGHKAENFDWFAHAYRKELSQNPEFPAFFQTLSEQTQPITLLYAAKDPKINHAVVLLDYIKRADAKAANEPDAS